MLASLYTSLKRVYNHNAPHIIEISANSSLNPYARSSDGSALRNAAHNARRMSHEVCSAFLFYSYSTEWVANPRSAIRETRCDPRDDGLRLKNGGRVVCMSL